MDKLTVKIILTVLALTLTGCSSSDDDIEKVPDKSAQSLFVDARTALDNGLYQKAIQILGAIDSRFPFGPISHQVQLDLIYAYYKSGNAGQGIALTDRFLRLNPNNSNVDYVYYMRALINISTEENLFQDLAGIDRTDRDPEASRSAFKDFKSIVTDYPDSKYAADARKRMIAIKSRLAQYEIAVAKYYIKREAYASAANRGRYIVEYFAPSPEIEQALEIMIESYDKLALTDLKKNAMQVLAANYPNNRLVR
ncbi:MAG: outer membrane protein assembly factor BamD [Colwellia sp.]|uniref:outer membrane protein assembly factor BamD n=1 Tax=Colwellia sp. TaxID=56799 RepID=UPI001DBC626F|nr:outer membrane protein assembly factor BamD [Colwellia sp.]NQY50087.1 outer membrane protein assembly factor BamD [Colwellia sp.]NQZ26330.1 outer membrane protein assembly factor BamD [Colwellia sp.]